MGTSKHSDCKGNLLQIISWAKTKRIIGILNATGGINNYQLIRKHLLQKNIKISSWCHDKNCIFSNQMEIKLINYPKMI